ncbi:hypothetical protein NXW05_22050 [Phocaeicola vulgatus]|nr:hypothetical protein [Phocaeicola vulgatus]
MILRILGSGCLIVPLMAFSEKCRSKYWSVHRLRGLIGKDRIKLIIGAALAIAAVMLGVLFFPISQPVAEELPSPSLIVSTDLDSSYSDTLDRYIESMSDEELAGWVELSENDIFIN